jgi:tetratricopeptide (TPR) repeat protein
VTIEAPPADQVARQTIERWRRAVEDAPESANACNNLAWAYLTAPPSIRDVGAALPLAEKAVRLAAGNPTFRNTLGVAYYRAGRHREAAEALRPNLRVSGNKHLALDLYFLAMTHHRLGAPAHALDLYEWANRWVRDQPNPSAEELEELTAFRTEAETLLGIGRTDVHPQPTAGPPIPTHRDPPGG